MINKVGFSPLEFLSKKIIDRYTKIGIIYQ